MTNNKINIKYLYLNILRHKWTINSSHEDSRYLYIRIVHSIKHDWHRTFLLSKL